MDDSIYGAASPSNMAAMQTGGGGQFTPGRAYPAQPSYGGSAMNPNLRYSPAPAGQLPYNQRATRPQYAPGTPTGSTGPAGVQRSAAMRPTPSPKAGYSPIMKTPSKISGPEKAEGVAAATADASVKGMADVVRGLVLAAFVAAGFIVPKSLRFLWIMLVGLYVVGETGLGVFSAWAAGGGGDESESGAKYVLWAVTALYAGVMVGLLIFLAWKLIAIAQARKKEESESSGSESESRRFRRRSRSVPMDPGSSDRLGLGESDGGDAMQGQGYGGSPDYPPSSFSY